MAEAGLRELRRFRAFTSIETDPARYYSMRAERAADAALQSGAISESEQRRWLDALRAARTSGGFLAGLTLLWVWGIRPPEPHSHASSEG